jgi:hypothetical protein
MTDEFAPNGPGSADTPPTPAAAATAKPGGRRAVIIVGLIVAFLAIVLFAVRNNVAADDLRVGDCFVIPNGTSIQTVEKLACTESHNAEVIFVGEHDGTTYPISLTLDRYIDENCVPAFEPYVGRPFESDPAMTIGYFYPSRETWDSGDRTITCYVSQPDDGPMTESVKG